MLRYCALKCIDVFSLLFTLTFINLKGFEDKSATALCILGFTEGPGKDVILCHGETKGTIVVPKGGQGFGWDSCFLPEGEEKTYAQLSFEEKNKVSHRRKALNKLKMHFS